MKSLVDLPSELLHQICSLLQLRSATCNPRSKIDLEEMWLARKTLSRLCRTCRRLCDIAQPVLFRALPLLHGPRSAGLCLRSAVESPSLAGYVRSWSMVNEEDYGLVDAQALISAVRKLSPHFNEMFATYQPLVDPELGEAPLREAGQRSTSDAAIALVFSVLPNLEHLDLSGLEDGAITSDLMQNVTKVPGLSRLRSINTYRYFKYQVTSLDGIADLLALPAMRTLRVKHMLDKGSLKLLPCTSNITEMNLRKNIFFARGLASLFSCCKSLQSLTYTAPRHGLLERDGVVSASPADVIHALHSQRLSIKRLRMQFDESYELPFWDHRFIRRKKGRGTIPSLEAFTALEVLRLDQSTLITNDQVLDETDDKDFIHNLLPFSIKCLTLCSVNEDMARTTIARLAAIARQELPNLEMVRIETTTASIKDDYRDLTPAFLQAGIAYRVC